MFFEKELMKIKEERKIEKLLLFIDMDGVIADYRFGEGKSIENNVVGTYINKRPIYATINNLKVLSEETWIELYILSSCFYIEQAEEKIKWLQKYVPFIKRENMFFTMNDNFVSRKQAKINVMKKFTESDESIFVSLIDDTHEILFKGIEQLGERFIPFHVSTLID